MNINPSPSTRLEHGAEIDPGLPAGHEVGTAGLVAGFVAAWKKVGGEPHQIHGCQVQALPLLDGWAAGATVMFLSDLSGRRSLGELSAIRFPHRAPVFTVATLTGWDARPLVCSHTWIHLR